MKLISELQEIILSLKLTINKIEEQEYSLKTFNTFPLKIYFMYKLFQPFHITIADLSNYDEFIANQLLFQFTDDQLELFNLLTEINLCFKSEDSISDSINLENYTLENKNILSCMLNIFTETLHPKSYKNILNLKELIYKDTFYEYIKWILELSIIFQIDDNPKNGTKYFSNEFIENIEFKSIFRDNLKLT